MHLMDCRTTFHCQRIMFIFPTLGMERRTTRATEAHSNPIPRWTGAVWTKRTQRRMRVPLIPTNFLRPNEPVPTRATAQTTSRDRKPESKTDMLEDRRRRTLTSLSGTDQTIRIIR